MDIRADLIRRKRPLVWGQLCAAALLYCILLAPWPAVPDWLVFLACVVLIAFVGLVVAALRVPKCPRCRVAIPLALPLRRYPWAKAINHCPYCGLQLDQPLAAAATHPLA